MANGIAIKDVDNKLQSLEGEEVIPISTGANEPEVVEVDTLKEYINADIDTALEGKQDVINDLATIRNGAALGATALQSYTESDPTVHAWAKAEQKPSYTASEVGAVPTTRKINNKALSSDITLTATDVNALPSSTVIPAAQIQSDWNQSNTSAKDYIKNKPEIPVLPTLADVATSGDYEDLTNTPTIPDVPEWAMSSTKPSYTVSEIDGAQEELVSGTNIKTINNESILGSGNITIQGGGGGDVNVIESITFNGSAVPVDSSKNAAITYSAPVTSVNGNTGDVTISIPTKVSDLTNDSGFITSYTETDPVFSASAAATITSADITAWNGKSTFSGSYNDLTDKPTLFSGDYNDLFNKPTIPTVPTNISAFTNDAGYITGYTETDPTVPSWAKASTKPSYTASEVGALPDTTSIPTESTVSGWGFTKNAGTITGITMNGASKGTSGVVDLGTVVTSTNNLINDSDTAQSKSGQLTVSSTTGNGLITGSTTNTAYTGVSSIRKCANDSDTVNVAGFIINSDGATKFIHRRGGIQNEEDAIVIFDATGIEFKAGCTKGTTTLTSVFKASASSNILQYKGNDIALKSDIPANVSDLNNDAGYTTNTGTVTSTGGNVTVNNIQVVSALPASPDANTLYLIPES